jgi:peptide/nickel transport system ATP-binding protein
MTPSLLDLRDGCAFRERCGRASDLCRNSPALTAPSPGRSLRCVHPHA